MMAWQSDAGEYCQRQDDHTCGRYQMTPAESMESGVVCFNFCRLLL